MDSGAQNTVSDIFIEVNTSQADPVDCKKLYDEIHCAVESYKNETANVPFKVERVLTRNNCNICTANGKCNVTIATITIFDIETSLCPKFKKFLEEKIQVEVQKQITVPNPTILVEFVFNPKNGPSKSTEAEFCMEVKGEAKDIIESIKKQAELWKLGVLTAKLSKNNILRRRHSEGNG